MQLSPEACRAARGLLGWSLQELAKATELSFETLSRFENGRPMRGSTAARVIAAFEAMGVDLVSEPDRTGAILTYARRG